MVLTEIATAAGVGITTGTPNRAGLRLGSRLKLYTYPQFYHAFYRNFEIFDGAAGIVG
jgi:hypothetical protein